MRPCRWSLWEPDESTSVITPAKLDLLTRLFEQANLPTFLTCQLAYSALVPTCIYIDAYILWPVGLLARFLADDICWGRFAVLRQTTFTSVKSLADSRSSYTADLPRRKHVCLPDTALYHASLLLDDWFPQGLKWWYSKVQFLLLVITKAIPGFKGHRFLQSFWWLSRRPHSGARETNSRGVRATSTRLVNLCTVVIWDNVFYIHYQQY